MAKIKLELHKLTIPEKIDRAEQTVLALTDNPNFPSPQPTLPDMLRASKELNTSLADSQASRQEAKAKTIIQNKKEEVFDRMFKQLASYIEGVSGDNEELIIATGINLRASAKSSEDLVAPDGLSATAGDHDGEIDLHWDKVSKAKSYILEQSIDPPSATSWSHLSVTTKSQFTVDGLASGTKYWFRVAAIGANGQSQWSNPVFKVIAF